MNNDYSGGKLIKVYLPQYIIDVFERDMENFEIKLNGKANLSNFCNRIFSYMKDKYMFEKMKIKDLFINNWMEKDFKEKLKKEFGLANDGISRVTGLITKKLNDILEGIFKPEKMVYTDYISFRLTNENGQKFAFIEKELGRKMTASDYFRSIFFSYALKTQFEREKIICYDVYEKIEKAIKNRNMLMIKMKTKKEAYEQIPCFIKESKEEMFNYVIVFDERKKIKTPRLSSIEEVFISENKKYSFAEKESEMLEKLKKNFDPLSIKSSEIKIKLSDTGKKMFKRMIHNRPNLERIEDEDTYVFNCSAAKTRAYFFKYGYNAFVVHPKELAESFRNEYKQAYEMYDKNRE